MNELLADGCCPNGGWGWGWERLEGFAFEMNEFELFFQRDQSWLDRLVFPALL